MGVYGIAILSFFSSGISVILILMCGPGGSTPLEGQPGYVFRDFCLKPGYRFYHFLS